MNQLIYVGLIYILKNNKGGIGFGSFIVEMFNLRDTLSSRETEREKVKCDPQCIYLNSHKQKNEVRQML